MNHLVHVQLAAIAGVAVVNPVAPGRTLRLEEPDEPIDETPISAMVSGVSDYDPCTRQTPVKGPTPDEINVFIFEPSMLQL